VSFICSHNVVFFIFLYSYKVSTMLWNVPATFGAKIPLILSIIFYRKYCQNLVGGNFRCDLRLKPRRNPIVKKNHNWPGTTVTFIEPLLTINYCIEVNQSARLGSLPSIFVTVCFQREKGYTSDIVFDDIMAKFSIFVLALFTASYVTGTG
jgi:hypothetical protein